MQNIHETNNISIIKNYESRRFKNKNGNYISEDIIKMIINASIDSSIETVGKNVIDAAMLALTTTTLLNLLSPAVLEVTERTPIFYNIQKGDTIWDIAQRFGVDYEYIIKINSERDPNFNPNLI